jgi:cobalt-zinc-cadmium efflux system protein
LHPVTVEPTGMIAFASLGLIVNSIIVLTLRGNSENMNIKSVFLHFTGDALADIGVLLGGALICFSGWSGIDTLLSAILSCLILRSAIKMTIVGIKIILEAAPEKIAITDVKQSITDINGVVAVSDIHIWSLSMETLAMTAHVCIPDSDIGKSEVILHDIQHLLKQRFNIGHSTIQFEHNPCSSCFHSKPDHQSKCDMCIDNCSEVN